MKRAAQHMDMLHGPLAGKILLFTLPIALSSMLQQLFNAADTSIVGSFGDANALAAVGANGEIVALIVTLSSGLALGQTSRSQDASAESSTRPFLVLLRPPCFWQSSQASRGYCWARGWPGGYCG